MYGILFGLVVLGCCVLLIVAGIRRFHSLVVSDVDALFLDSNASVGPDQLRARWTGLPEPVQRYLKYAISEGAPAIRTARLKHHGQFRTKPGQRWLPIQGCQYFLAAKPGFVWNASVRLAPMLWVEARDRLLSGRGNMLVKIVSTFTVADAAGAEIDQGSGLRWLAEGAWFPYSFVGDQVEWQEIDERSAQVTLRHEGLPVTAIVEIDDDGKLTHLRAKRYRDVGSGKAILSPWTGQYSDYRDFNGFRAPTSIEVTWELESGAFSYARFRVTTIEYNVSGKVLNSGL